MLKNSSAVNKKYRGYLVGIDNLENRSLREVLTSLHGRKFKSKINLPKEKVDVTFVVEGGNLYGEFLSRETIAEDKFFLLADIDFEINIASKEVISVSSVSQLYLTPNEDEVDVSKHTKVTRCTK